VLTVYTKKQRVDINSAPPEVLAALPGMSVQAVKRLLKNRDMAPFEDYDSVRQALGEHYYRLIGPWVTISPSRVYTIISEAWLKESNARHGMMAVVQVSRRGKLETLYWVDDTFYAWPEED
jgi:type II secretory pathway component PulK